MSPPRTTRPKRPVHRDKSAAVRRHASALARENERNELLVTRFADEVNRARGTAHYQFPSFIILWLVLALAPTAVLGVAQVVDSKILPALLLPAAAVSAAGLLGGLLMTVLSALTNALAFQGQQYARARRFQILLVWLSTGIVVLAFAAIYFIATGLGGGDVVSGGGRDFDFATAVYFSITTLTSTGYGDWTPKGGLRLFANAEMIAGYLLFGSLISALVSHLSSREREPDLVTLIEGAIDRAGLGDEDRNKLLGFIEDGLQTSSSPILPDRITGIIEHRLSRTRGAALTCDSAAAGTPAAADRQRHARLTGKAPEQQENT